MAIKAIVLFCINNIKGQFNWIWSCVSGATPLLLLPENIRVRRFNLQTKTYHDFLEEEEHIMALDYDWDHNNTGFSKSCTDGYGILQLQDPAASVQTLIDKVFYNEFVVL